MSLAYLCICYVLTLCLLNFNFIFMSVPSHDFYWLSLPGPGTLKCRLCRRSSWCESFLVLEIGPIDYWLLIRLIAIEIDIYMEYLLEQPVNYKDQEPTVIELLPSGGPRSVMDCMHFGSHYQSLGTVENFWASFFCFRLKITW